MQNFHFLPLSIGGSVGTSQIICYGVVELLGYIMIASKKRTTNRYVYVFDIQKMFTFKKAYNA